MAVAATKEQAKSLAPFIRATTSLPKHPDICVVCVNCTIDADKHQCPGGEYVSNVKRRFAIATELATLASICAPYQGAVIDTVNEATVIPPGLRLA